MSESTGERMIVGEASYPLFQQHLNRYLFASQFVRQRRVLDVACGSGYGTSRLQQEGATLVIGVDIAWEACQQARSLYGVNVVMADAVRLPFRDLSFETIVSFETIEHISKPDNFLARCRQLLDSSGRFVVSTPNRQMSIFQDNPYHFREYRPQEFVDLLQRFFSHIQVYGQLYRSYPLRLVSRVTAKGLSRVLGGQRLVALVRERLLGDRPLQPPDLSFIDETYEVMPMNDLKERMVQPHFVICVAEV